MKPPHTAEVMHRLVRRTPTLLHSVEHVAQRTKRKALKSAILPVTRHPRVHSRLGLERAVLRAALGIEPRSAGEHPNQPRTPVALVRHEPLASHVTTLTATTGHQMGHPLHR